MQVYVLVIVMHQAWKAHDLDVAAAVEVPFDLEVVGMTALEFLQSLQPVATAVLASDAISQHQLDLVHFWIPEMLVASEVVHDFEVDSVMLEVVHKAFVVEAVESPVVDLPPSSLSLSSQILQATWLVLAIVDSFRRSIFPLFSRSAREYIQFRSRT